MAKISPKTVWQSAPRPKFRKVTQSAEFDAVVIGGGITGLTAAYLLKQAGKRVAVVERYRLGYMDTGLTTAHLTFVTDKRLPQLVKEFGEDAARLAWQAGAHAIDVIERIVGDLGIDCEFRRASGYLQESLNATEDEAELLQHDAETAASLGFAAKYLPRVPYFNRPGVEFPEQAKFHPLKYLAGLATAVEGDGSRIFEQSEVAEVRDTPQRVVVGKHELQADYVVIATHIPLTGKTGLVNAALFQSKLFPYSSYVVGAKIPKSILPDASFWDTSEPYYYLRIEPGKTKDYAIFGGEDHKTGQESDTQERFDKLREKLASILPEVQPDRQWSGQVVETNDGLPYMGESAERQFVATGFGGNGMTFGTLAAEMARDAMLGTDNPWQPLFSLKRKSLRGGALTYATENIDYPYYLVKDRLSRPDTVDPEELERGEGKVLLLDGERVACARDREGKLSTVSAFCTHLGCVVHWNNAEQTWDCPCHGSRFKPSGEVLAGPAEKPLAVHAGVAASAAP